MQESIIHSDTVIEAFTELAPGYEECMQQELTQFWGINYQDFIQDFVSLADIRNGEFVLDIATGTARIPRFIIQGSAKPAQVIGLDITYAMLDHGNRKLKDQDDSRHIRLVCASALDLPFHSQSLDVILCGLGTHHIPVPRLVSEMHRVLKPGGRLLLADVCASTFWRSYLGNLLIRYMAQRYQTNNQSVRTEAELEAFQNVRTVQEWQNILHSNQFINIHIKEVKSRLPWYPNGFQASAQAG